MKRIECTPQPSHILILDGERFFVYHVERRLYSFTDWKESRDKIIKIMLARIKKETGENSAFIKFSMANPMRKTRLGNFYLDLKVDIKVNGKVLGTLEELGMKNMFFDCFEVLDKHEIEMRAEKEALYSNVQYNKEFSSRLDNLLTNNDNLKMIIHSQECFSDRVKKSMEKDGWSEKYDNRFFARYKRCGSNHN